MSTTASVDLTQCRRRRARGSAAPAATGSTPAAARRRNSAFSRSSAARRAVRSSTLGVGEVALSLPAMGCPFVPGGADAAPPWRHPSIADQAERRPQGLRPDLLAGREFRRALAEIDDDLDERIQGLRRAQGRLRDLASGSAQPLPAEVDRFLDQLRAIGLSERWTTMERDLWILVLVAHPETATELLRDQAGTLANPSHEGSTWTTTGPTTSAPATPQSATSPGASSRRPGRATGRATSPAR